MSFPAKFSDVEINVQDIDGKPMLTEQIVSDREAKPIEVDVPNFLRPVSTSRSDYFEHAFDYLQLEHFDPKTSRSREEITELLVTSISLVKAIKFLHQNSLSIGLLSSSRFYLNDKSELIILGNSLINDTPAEFGFEYYALEDFYYLAPECYENIQLTPDYRADFYSLGVNLYVWYTGSLPFKGDDKMQLMHHHLTRIPIVPKEINPAIPEGLSDLILTLLAKQPEGRYASAFGILQDLEAILNAFEKGNDSPVQLHIDYNPGKIDFGSTLFGRDGMLKELEDRYSRAEHFHSQIVFVEGFSGVGKTSLLQRFINETSSKKTIALEGKFDQYKQAPYTAVQMAFSDLERQLLLKSNIDRKKLKKILVDELGKNVGVLQGIVPSIGFLVGDFEPVEVLNPIETRNRFNYVFQKFCKAITGLGLYIVLFIDDWQWCDPPSLELMKSLAQQEGKGILLLFAFRGNEVDGNHPFHLFKTENTKLPHCHHFIVDPLERRLSNQMIATALGMDESETTELSKLIFDKTGGNPFFIKQFVNSLYQKGFLKYDFDKHFWSWDHSGIKKEGLAQNVIDLITQKIDTLSYEVQIIFKIASCVAGKFDLDLISEISGIEKTLIPILLDVSMGSGYISKSRQKDVQRYHFTHDRVQQVSYQLTIPAFPLTNEQLHLQIGEYFLKKGANKSYSVGEILLHFLAAKELISKRDTTTVINLILGLNGDSALSVTPEASKQHFELALYLSKKFKIRKHLFDCYLGLSEACCLLNDLASAEAYADKAYDSTENILEKVRLLRMKMLFYESYAMFEKNIETGLQALTLFKIEGEEHHVKNTLGPLIEKEYQLFNSLTGTRDLFYELSKRKMTSPEELAIMDVLVNMNASAYFVNLYLFAWSTLKMANQTLRHGLTNSTPFALVFVGSLLVALYKEFDRGYNFGKLGVELLKKVENDQYKSRTLSVFPIFIQHFKEPILAGTVNLDESIYSGLETGDLPYAGYSFYAKVRDAFLAGNDLSETLDLCDESIAFMQNVNNQGLLALMRLLKGSILKLLNKYDSNYGAVEREALQFLLDVKFFTAVSHHYIFRSWTHCILREYKLASELLKQNGEIVVYAASQPHVPKHYFLDSLCLLYQNPTLLKAQEKRIQDNQSTLKLWSDSMPENFSAEYYLIETLLKSRKGNMEEALASFNLSLKWAEKGRLMGVKALSYEVASDMLKSSEYSILATGFEENAKSVYAQWNAWAKTEIQEKDSFSRSKGADLNTASLIKSMQAISSEVNKGDVIGKLLGVIMENAGADRSILILTEKGIPYVEAEITSEKEMKSLGKNPLHKSKIPTNIIEYVIDSKKEFVLESQKSIADVDSKYIDKNNILSLLALPLLRQKELIGVLYLENHQFSGLFKGSDLEILRVIASQAAISIYNTLLFEETSGLNMELQKSKDELSKMNLLLEEKIKDRTKVLRQEIEIRKKVEVELKKAQKEAEKFHQQQIKEERQEALQSKMMMLSSQMNPHFIFNSLGSVQSYILSKETNRAVDFISEFAGLMRKNLINSTTKYISISEELEFLDKYLLLEKIRFNNNFDYSITETIDNLHDTLIPPMLLQPFIENAVIHGLSKLKERKGKLKVNLDEVEDRIVCTIEDNGIGRENALKHRSPGHKSVAISNLETRLELLNNSEEANEYTYEIVDLKDEKGPTGTKVTVCFPNDLH
ncbi:AAA family ATPase [Winogradskyella sp.]|uniref:AAA family ATPase n=1 Tax=Winogradskyella sp. TaxID=1883156 RepID=UPI00262C8D1B|nr:AAA family ATPase [Winogradskyella sp.]